MATRTRTSVDLMRTSNLTFYFSCISSTIRQIYVFFFGGCLLPYFHARILLFPFTPFFSSLFPLAFTGGKLMYIGRSYLSCALFFFLFAFTPVLSHVSRLLWCAFVFVPAGSLMSFKHKRIKGMGERRTQSTAS